MMIEISDCFTTTWWRGRDLNECGFGCQLFHINNNNNNNNNLVRKKGLEGVRLGMRAGPHQVEVRVGVAHLRDRYIDDIRQHFRN